MFITLDIDQQPWQTDEVTVTVISTYNKNNREYVREVTTFTAPKYQAIVMQRALKDANPDDYKSANILRLVTTDNNLVLG